MASGNRFGGDQANRSEPAPKVGGEAASSGEADWLTAMAALSAAITIHRAAICSRKRRIRLLSP